MALSFILIMDIIGTIAFAVSGAFVAIRRGMDIFGVNILAITTSVGGGIIRDILMGRFPPVMFYNPMYVLIAVVVANLVFLILYFKKDMDRKEYYDIYEKILFLFDTLGLGAFTVDGVNTGMSSQLPQNLFFVIFLGVLTGVGGGVLRDVMANRLPYIFVKHIYACASLAGAVITALLYHRIGKNAAMVIGFITVILIRVLAAYFKWNLPVIKNTEK